MKYLWCWIYGGQGKVLRSYVSEGIEAPCATSARAGLTFLSDSHPLTPGPSRIRAPQGGSRTFSNTQHIFCTFSGHGPGTAHIIHGYPSGVFALHIGCRHQFCIVIVTSFSKHSYCFYGFWLWLQTLFARWGIFSASWFACEAYWQLFIPYTPVHEISDNDKIFVLVLQALLLSPSP